MAILYGGFDRIKIKYPDIELKNTKIIGWGGGQWFTDYYPLLNIDLSYTVCPRTERDGQFINGIPVRPISALKEEDPDNTVIVIFASHSSEIMNQIRDFVGFKCVRALDFSLNNISSINNLLSIQNNIQDITCWKPEIKSNIGFFYQGPIYPYTELGLIYQRIKYPNDYHCLVTYVNTPQEDLRKCSQWVDEVIQIDEAKKDAYFIYNNMLLSARAGANKILQEGFQYAVRVRSGNIVEGDVSNYILKNYGANDELNSGKFGFRMETSWKNVPFHISDTFMIGRTKDMSEFWSAPEHTHPPQTLTGDMHFSQLSKVTSESYLWMNYARKKGYPTDTIEDYLKFMLAKLIPLEPSVKTHSLKHIPIFNLDYDNGMAPDINWWKSLNNNFDKELQRSLARFNGKFTIDDFWKNKIG